MDLLIEKAHELIGVEAKSGMTTTLDQLSGLQKLNQTVNDIKVRGVLVYAGNEKRTINTIQLLPWRDFVSSL